MNTLVPDPPRPSPDALLERARREQRGKLKVFLGAAPGVGKTYEMLSSARKKQRDGVDVVIGIVETHGRRETMALLEGLPLLARKRVPYEGRELEEMDLDAILARKPQLVLVDELAHTNAPGSRHPKRHMDVEELLGTGIDVYSTLNIQHLESLNDVVASITRVRVRETVPDAILDLADEIEVIDITPEELIERLREGKVYHGDAGERALQGYFNTGNLTALRELALRRTAERVDEQLRHHRRAQGIQDVWAAGESVLVCITESPGSQALVRRAKRLADRFDAPWTALYLETARSLQLDERQRDQIAETLRLAERLDGNALSIPGSSDIAGDVLAYASEHNVTHIVTGKSRRSRWFELLHGSVVDQLVRRARNISIHVIADPEVEKKPVAPRRLGRAGNWNLAALLPVTLLVAAATSLGWVIHAATKVHNVALIFLAAVMISATRYGLVPSLYAALASSAAYNFFFLEPRYNFTIGDPANVLSLIFFIAVSVLVSQLMVRLREQGMATREQAHSTAELLNFTRRLAGLRKLEELLAVTAEQTTRILDLQAVVLLPEDDGQRLRADPAGPLDEKDLAAAHWCFEKGQPTGRGADTLPGASRLYVPLRTPAGIVGVLGVQRGDGEFLLHPSERRMIDTIADLAAITVERIRLAKQIDQARTLAETEQLRSALLTSISHDLRTPLASIMGSISSLRSYDAMYTAGQREELLVTAQDETERMHRFVGNLLDMTRLDAGALQPKRETCELQEIVGSALQHTARLLERHQVVTAYAPDLPMLSLDFVLMEQVLVNLLENAGKYAPEGSRIEVSAQRHRYAVSIEVRDEGPGIPEADLQRIFDPFFRIRGGDRQRAGIGLGLAVCRGFVDAMGGRIRARNRRERSGSVFEIELPSSLFVAPAQGIES
ncbi:sensor histidine kinase KdpD [Solimonas sp. K1W22B-7]|uniref:sensor histidine kinase n=1 Tax=Solimonas sp. K1W22B-7 TaxID=2303331 RepID=UPI000E330770|nr:sensor histidine kinase KdpD [Solimonas sp. K1W22B-7]AXQ29531.1 sensor histidine kinase KdpD [Solimonas sp. K1W22B-7]